MKRRSRITGRRWTRGERVHPIWCDVVRCLSDYAGTQGGHHSEPMVADVPGLGRAIMTLAQFPGRAAYLEVRVVARVPDSDDTRQRLHAERLLVDLTATINRVALHARADAALADVATRPAIGQ